MGALPLRLELEGRCHTRTGAVGLGVRVRWGPAAPPGSQSLIAMSSEPETIHLLLGEKPTERIVPLWAPFLRAVVTKIGAFFAASMAAPIAWEQS